MGKKTKINHQALRAPCKKNKRNKKDPTKFKNRLTNTSNYIVPHPESLTLPPLCPPLTEENLLLATKLEMFLRRVMYSIVASSLRSFLLANSVTNSLVDNGNLDIQQYLRILLSLSKRSKSQNIPTGCLIRSKDGRNSVSHGKRTETFYFWKRYLTEWKNLVGSINDTNAAQEIENLITSLDNGSSLLNWLDEQLCEEWFLLPLSRPLSISREDEKRGVENMFFLADIITNIFAPAVYNYATKNGWITNPNNEHDLHGHLIMLIEKYEKDPTFLRNTTIPEYPDFKKQLETALEGRLAVDHARLAEMIETWRIKEYLISWYCVSKTIGDEEAAAKIHFLHINSANFDTTYTQLIATFDDFTYSWPS